VLTFVTIFSYAAVAAFVVGLVLCVARRWRLAATLSSALSLASAAVFVLLLCRFLLAFFGSTDASSKAVVLSQSVSELMNCGALPVLVAIASALLWDVAHRRATRL
jgi:hypothetical protein